MRTFSPGRQLLAALAPAVLSLLLLGSASQRALAGEELRECLMREADQFFTKLAIALGSFELDPISVDDAYIAREAAPIPAKCTNSTGQSDEADLAAFRKHMTRWAYHLDRKLSEITAKGTVD